MMTGVDKKAWNASLRIIESLRAHGFEALLAGGCVRDQLLDRTPKDYDVATDATPEDVKRLFPKARMVGAQFGVMLVRKFGVDVEVATFRTEGAYSDGRRPDSVTFATSREDASRRDFTINGLFLDPIENRVIDYVDGRADLEAGVIRTIGDPTKRFAEDHLRMLRAVRFAARFGFQIEAATLKAIQQHASRLLSISAERIAMELEMVLVAPTRARGWSLLCETTLRRFLSNDWKASTDEDAMITARLAALPADLIHPALGFACALCACTPGQAKRIGRSLRLSNEVIDAVTWLLDQLVAVRSNAEMEVADLKLLMATGRWTMLMALHKADLTARCEDLDPNDRLCARADAIPLTEVAPPPLLTGHDLDDMGVAPGPQMGRVLQGMYRAQLNGQIKSVEEAREYARLLIGKT